jgi:hypothetical protein
MITNCKYLIREILVVVELLIFFQCYGIAVENIAFVEFQAIVRISASLTFKCSLLLSYGG